MTRIRLLPLVVIAAVVLLALKVVEATEGGRLRAALEGGTVTRAVEAVDRPTAAAQTAVAKRGRPAERVAVDPIGGGEVDMIATGSSDAHGGEPPKEAEGGGEHGAAAPAAGGVTPSKVDTAVGGTRPDEARPLPGQELLGEIDILQKLAARRRQIEAMQKELDMREDLLKASEARIGKRVDELKALEDRVGAAQQAKEEAQKQQLTDLVKMYESMKAKDAARVFDRLDIALLADIARQMNPKKLGDIVAKMTPEQAEKLTVELADRKVREAAPMPQQDLPKIEGKSG